VHQGLAFYVVDVYESGNLAHAMSFLAKIVAINEVEKGDMIGYNGKWQTDKKSTIAVVSAGYADGYHDSVPNGIPIFIHKQQCQIVGKVSMDLLTVDIYSIKSKVKVGDEVELWGKNIQPELIASKSQVSAYSLGCVITERVIKFLV